MRCIVEYKERQNDVPLLRIYVHGAPHRRQHRAILQVYREKLIEAAHDAKIKIPIRNNIELWALFIDACSPDTDNLITALFIALDGKTLKGPSILVDDRLIIGHSAYLFLPLDRYAVR